MKLSILLVALLGLVPATLAQAEIGLDFQADQLLDANGNPMPTNGLVLIVADTGSSSTFAPLQAGTSLAIGSDLTGTGDRIVGAFDMSLWGSASAGEPGAFENTTQTFNLSSVTNWSPGDGLELVWMPTLTLNSLGTDLSAGTAYGAFAGPTGSGGESWVTPADGLNGYYTFFTTGGDFLGTGNFPTSDALADFTVEGAAVPEPRSYALMLTGLAVLTVLVRRKKLSRV